MVLDIVGRGSTILFGAKPFAMRGWESRITRMKRRSQERKMATLALLLWLGTAYGVQADPFDDLMTKDKDDEYSPSSSSSSDKSVDPQSKLDFRREEEREIKELRKRREAKDAELDFKARQSRSLYDPLDGSEFNKKTFMDTDFRKQSFTDLSISKRRSDTRPDDDGPRTRDLFGKSDDDRTADYYRRAKERRDLREKERDKKIWLDLKKPIPYVLLDWVPRAADPIHNGGFEREADNGTPVPYHLNGHPDFERKLPWSE